MESCFAQNSKYKVTYSTSSAGMRSELQVITENVIADTTVFELFRLLLSLKVWDKWFSWISRIIQLDHLEAVVCPAAELHDTGLLVEGEVLHVHLAGAVVDGGGFPLDESLAVESGLGGQSHLEVAVSTWVKIARSGVETDWDFADKSADFSNPN